MLSKLQTLKNKHEGFTIIEVLIVLAIAALILVVVLVAIPQLQRNQRNNARKALGARIASEIGNYIGNNNGVPPVATVGSANTNIGSPRNITGGFFHRYLGCGVEPVPSGTNDIAAGNAVPANTCSTDITDPSSGFPVGTGAQGTTQGVTVAANSLGGVAGDLEYRTGQICSGELTVAGGARNYTLRMRLEGGAIACFDNH